MAGEVPAPEPIKLPNLADSDDEAARRFAATRGTDPFPDVDSALLNTADLLDYIAATGMVHPFNVNAANPSVLLKPASCGIPLVGTAIWWENEPGQAPQLVELDVKPGEKLSLKRNSIVFVTLEPKLRMPDYIAARFNLTIRDIYRGVLVGTGPLVDPGFTGKLSLPLHNLTFNDYELIGGEPIVWMEFTKLSTNKRWANGPENERIGEYVSFPDRKRNRETVHDYVRYASANPITSSIPPLVEEARDAAASAEQAAQRQLRWSIFAAVAVVVGVAAVAIAAFTLVDGVDSRQHDLAHNVEQLQSEVTALRKDVSVRQPTTSKSPQSPKAINP